MATFLYVEDNVDNLRLMCLMIKRLYPDDVILSARTAEEGIYTALEKRPDLILMDIGLPGMDGYDALDILRGMDSLRRVPVIAVSAHAMPEDISRGLEAGFAAYITKPVNIRELNDTIDRFLPTNDIAQMN